MAQVQYYGTGRRKSSVARVRLVPGTGKIIIADSPVQGCDFERLITISGYGRLVDYYRSKGLNIEILDLRSKASDSNYKIVDLGNDSEHFQTNDEDESHHYRVTNYDPEETEKHHSDRYKCGKI